jgi:hypothetical protein
MKNKFSNLCRLQALVLCLALLIYAISLFVKFDQLNASPFREAQTALSIYYFIGESVSNIFNYQTPLLGPSWQIPFEVPIYQVIVSRFAEANPKSIIYVAKIINFICFGLSLLLIRSLAKDLLKTKSDSFYLMVLLLFSPVYVVYATSVSIEFTALCLCLTMLYCFKHYCLNKQSGLRFLYLAFALVSSILASAAKVTTWLAFGLPFLYLLYFYYKQGTVVSNFKYRFSFVLGYALINCVTFFLIIIWIQYSDTIKLENPLSAQLTSQSLRNWNHFSIEQLISTNFWLSIFSKHLVTSGGVILFFVAIVGLFMNIFKDGRLNDNFDKTDLWASLLLIIFYLIPTFVFANLFYRHEYYLISTNLFLLGSLYLFMRAFFKNFLENYVLKIILLLSLLIMSSSYLTLKKLYTVPRDVFAIEFLREQKPGHVIMSGFGFSSFIPFLSERKALMLFDHNYNLKNETFNNKVKQIDWTGVLISSDDMPLVEEYLHTIDYQYLEKKYLPYDLIYYSKFDNIPLIEQPVSPCFERYSFFVMSNQNSAGKFIYDLATLQFMYTKGSSQLFLSLKDLCVTRVKL